MTNEIEKHYQKSTEHLNRIIENLNQHWHSIQLLLGHVSKPLIIDDRGLANHLRKFSEDIGKFIDEMRGFDFAQSAAEIKFIGKRLDGIEKTLNEMNDKGIKKNIHLDLTLDGYEMVRKPINYDPTEETKPNSDENLDKVLNTLTIKEQLSIRYRLGIGVKRCKTYKELGLVLKTSGDRSSQIYRKALRKLRHPTRIDFIRKCNHLELRKEVTGD